MKEPQEDWVPDISVVIVGYEMARELPRTVLSLSKPYQQGLEGVRLEVIVIDNGSAQGMPDLPVLDEDGPDEAGQVLRAVRADPVSPSPVGALNQGLAMARGRLVGAWIDGARLASPGVLAACLAAAGQAERAVVATQNYHLGNLRHAMASELGHDQAVEDALLESIGWPQDGYRLFEISRPELARPDAPLLETNGLFMAATLWGDLGGFDMAFDEPGGGMANPDMLRRAVDAPDTALIRVIGEGTFHQFHGGITTSEPKQAARLMMESSKRYAALRGAPPKSVREVGVLFPSPLSPVAGLFNPKPTA